MEHQHEHDHKHGGLGHHHHDTDHLSDARLIGTVTLNMVLTVAEVVIGVISGSLSLIADAVHNFGDAAALVIALIARRIARRDADQRFTFGYKRAETIGALINLTTLVLIAIFLIKESIERFLDPQPILAGWVMIAAGVALAVDLLTVALLWAMSQGNLNIRAAFIHNLTDAAASVAVLLGAWAYSVFGWMWIDPALTLLIAGYILLTSLSMLKRSVSILMNNVPPGLDLDELKASLEKFEDIRELHHIHVWELDETARALEAHVVLEESMSLEAIHPIKLRLKEHLTEKFRIRHSTLEFETPNQKCTEPNC